MLRSCSAPALCRRRAAQKAGALLSLLICLLAVTVAHAKKPCKKGKKPCGERCIPAKKECKELPGGEAAPAPEGEPDKAALTCKKGKKPCGERCIPAKKECKDAPPPATVEMASASSEEVAAALGSQAGKATLQLARVLQAGGDLEVTDKQREVFRQSLKGIRPPLPICDISHVQLVRDCDATIGGTVTLPCYLAVDELADVCKLFGQTMPMIK